MPHCCIASDPVCEQVQCMSLAACCAGILLAVAQAGCCGPAYFRIAVLRAASNTDKPVSAASLHSERICYCIIIVCAGKSRTVAAAMKTCESPQLRVASVVGGDKSSNISWPGRVLLALGYPNGIFCMITCMCSNSNTRQQLQSNAYYTVGATLFAVRAVVSHEVDLAKLQCVMTGQSKHHDPTPVLVVIERMKVVNSPAGHKQLMELFQVTMVCHALQATSAH